MGVRRGRCAVVAGGVVLALAACTTPSDSSARHSDSSASRSTATTTPGGASASATPSAAAPSTARDPREVQALLDAARERGSVPVIVTLAVAYTPEAELPDPAAVRQQRARIADAQQRLVAELAGYRTEVGSRYERLPQLAVSVDEAALRHLLASALVTKIQQDRPDSTTD